MGFEFLGRIGDDSGAIGGELVDHAGRIYRLDDVRIQRGGDSGWRGRRNQNTDPAREYLIGITGFGRRRP